MKMKNRLNIQLKLWHKDKLVISTYRRIKSRILALAQERLWDKCYVRIIYDRRRRFFNDGEYFNYKDLKEVLSAFTEKPLLDYILGDANE